MKYIRLFRDQYEVLKTQHTTDEIGKLVVALGDYVFYGKEPCFDGNERFSWGFLKNAADKQIESYEAKCSANKENGKLGGRPAKSVLSETQKTQMVYENPDGLSETHLLRQEQYNNKNKSNSNTSYNYDSGAAGAGAALYVESVVGKLTGKQREELGSFGLPDEVVKYAADEAAAHDKKTWAYVRGILNRFLEQGITSVEQAKNTAAPKQPEAPRPKYRWVGDDDDC